MKKILLAICLLYTLTISINAELLNKIYSANEGKKIRIGTYNIAGGAPSFNLNLNRTAKAIKALEIDFIALQEVDNGTNRSGNINQAKELAKLTGYNYIFSKAIDYDEGEYGIAVLSKYPIKLIEKQMLPSGDYEQRIVIYVEAKIPEFEESLLFVATHLDWHEDPEVRLNQIRAINGKTIDMRGIKFLLGDLNDTRESIVIEELERYWESPLLNNSIDNRTWPANNPEIGIDYIFTSKAQKWIVDEILIPNKPNGSYRRNWNEISDHIPVVLELTLIEQ